ncbi:hypothetical protein KVV02_000085, partial [Mortierella alpina]
MLTLIKQNSRKRCASDPRTSSSSSVSSVSYSPTLDTTFSSPSSTSSSFSSMVGVASTHESNEPGLHSNTPMPQRNVNYSDSTDPGFDHGVSHEGSFGRVHLVQSRFNSRFYAMKVLKKTEVVRLKQVEHTNNEKMILERVEHPFLINMWGTFQDVRNLYMVMDYVVGGELFTVLRKSQ